MGGSNLKGDLNDNNDKVKEEEEEEYGEIFLQACMRATHGLLWSCSWLFVGKRGGGNNSITAGDESARTQHSASGVKQLSTQLGGGWQGKKAASLPMGPHPSPGLSWWC